VSLSSSNYVAGSPDVHRQGLTAFPQSPRLPTTEVSTPTTTSLADVGLLILRIGVGETMLQAGLIKAFDFGATVNFMESGGWRLPR
jgi:hypothetical protein